MKNNAAQKEKIFFEGKNILFIYAIAVVLSACSILYELLIAQSLSLAAGNTVKWYSLTIGTYLGAMGIGAIAVGRWIKGKEPPKLLLKIEIFLALAGSLAVVGVFFIHLLDIYFFLIGSDVKGTILFFTGAFFIVSFIGVLTGAELPLLIRIANSFSPERKITNRVLGVNYLGALLGAVAFPLILVPNFSGVKIGIIVALLNALVALVMYLFLIEKELKIHFVIAGVVIVLLLFEKAYHVADGVNQYYLEKYYYSAELTQDLKTFFARDDRYPEISRTYSPYQKIDLVNSVSINLPDFLIDAYSRKYSEDENFPSGVTLYLNGDWQLYSDMEEVYHEYFAHIPIILSGEVPERILVLGGGDGVLNRELLKYDGVKEIVQVDLDAKMIEVAKNDPVLKYINKNSLEDERVKLLIGDAFYFIRKTEEKFDAIYIDFPAPIDYNTSKLYSREFYNFVARNLKEGGYLALDAPGSATFTYPDQESRQVMDKTQSDWPFFYNTLKAAGYHTVVPFVTNFESDNPEARKIAEELTKDFQMPEEYQSEDYPGVSEGGADYSEEKMKEETKDRMIRDFIWSMQQGFIFATKNRKEFFLDYRDLGIPLYVLNEKRFQLAFALPYESTESVNWNLVNSIMCPTLPNLPITFVRTP